MIKRWNVGNVDRRSLLRGFGLAGLAASALIGQRRARGAGAMPPRRLCFFFTPGGFFPQDWQPQAMWSEENKGKPFDLPLDEVTWGTAYRGDRPGVVGNLAVGARRSPLDLLETPKYAPLKKELIVLDGVNMRSMEGRNHKTGMWAALRASIANAPSFVQTSPGVAKVQTDPGPFPKWSIDRVIGAHMFPDGSRPWQIKSPSLNLQISAYSNSNGFDNLIRNYCEGGTSLEATTVPGMWDSLFKDFASPGSGPAAGPSPALVDAYNRRRTATEYTKAEIDELKLLLGKEEQVALDRHLTALRETTLQVENEFKFSSGGGGSRAGTVPPRSEETLAMDPRRDLPRMWDAASAVLAQGFAFDRFRVGVAHTFGQLQNTTHWYAGSTGLCHSEASGPLHGGRFTVHGYNYGRAVLEMFFDFLLKLKSIRDGDGTLLDSTAVATFADMTHGDHGHTEPGLFIIGGGGGWAAPGRRVYKTGRYVKFVNRGHNDYLVALAHGMGVTEYTRSDGKRAPLIQLGPAEFNQGPLTGLMT